MRVHAVQLEIVWEDKPTNRRRAGELIEAVGVEPGDLVVLPELFDTGFSFKTERTLDADGETLAWAKALADRLGITLQASRTVPSTTQGMALNEATIVGHTIKDGVTAYHKVHPFSFGREAERFVGGESLTTFEWGGMTVCPAICYDLRFPELFRVGRGMGAQMFTLGANWPAPRASHWRALAIARAIENQAYFVACNRCGDDPHLPYAGGSLIVGPKGEVLAEAGGDEVVLSAEVKLGEVEGWRGEFRAWEDRRAFLIEGERSG